MRVPTYFEYPEWQHIMNISNKNVQYCSYNSRLIHPIYKAYSLYILIYNLFFQRSSLKTFIALSYKWTLDSSASSICVLYVLQHYWDSHLNQHVTVQHSFSA